MKVRCLGIARKTVILAIALVSLAACQTMGGFGLGGQADGVGSTLLTAAQEAESKHNYGDAAIAYGRLYAGNPKSTKLLSAFLRNSRYSGQALDSIAFVEAESQLLLDDPSVKFEYAKALVAIGRKADALIQLQDVLKATPNDWQVHSALGITYDALGKYGESALAYNAALVLSPNNEVVMNNLAMSQAMHGKLDLAIATLEKAALINRQNAHIRQNLALLYAVNGDVKKARALASMDLDSGDLETNLSFYRRFEGGKK